jgi:hypothetical protein
MESKNISINMIFGSFYSTWNKFWFKKTMSKLMNWKIQFRKNCKNVSYIIENKIRTDLKLENRMEKSQILFVIWITFKTSWEGLKIFQIWIGVISICSATHNEVWDVKWMIWLRLNNKKK